MHDIGELRRIVSSGAVARAPPAVAARRSSMPRRGRHCRRRLARRPTGRCSASGASAALVHMALRRRRRAATSPSSRSTARTGVFPSLGRVHPPALRLERAIRDLFGLEAGGAPDARPWLDHGRWPMRHPLGAAHGRTGRRALRLRFLPAEGESLHQIPVGPVHAGIIEPGHFRFTANGETVVRLEERLGYVHKGIEGLMAGADARPTRRGSPAASRATAPSPTRSPSPARSRPRSESRRRRARFGCARSWPSWSASPTISATSAPSATTPSFSLHARPLRRPARARAARRRRLLRPPADDGLRRARRRRGRSRRRRRSGIGALVGELAPRFPELVELYDNTASLQDRTVGTGIPQPALAQQFGAGGYVGRASGPRASMRAAAPGYPPYPYARIRRARPRRRATSMPASGSASARSSRASPCRADPGAAAGGSDRAIAVAAGGAAGEGMALVEGFRGDILAWVRLGADGRVERCHLRDPSWFQWPLLEAAIEGNIVADFPLCNKSFNCSYSGHDL